MFRWQFMAEGWKSWDLRGCKFIKLTVLILQHIFANSRWYLGIIGIVVNKQVVRSYFWIHLSHVCYKASYFSIMESCITAGIPLQSIFTKISATRNISLAVAEKRSCLWWYPQIPDVSWVWPPMSIDLSFWREKFMLSIMYSPKINFDFTRCISNLVTDSVSWQKNWGHFIFHYQFLDAEWFPLLYTGRN